MSARGTPRKETLSAHSAAENSWLGCIRSSFLLLLLCFPVTLTSAAQNETQWLQIFTLRRVKTSDCTVQHPSRLSRPEGAWRRRCSFSFPFAAQMRCPCPQLTCTDSLKTDRRTEREKEKGGQGISCFSWQAAETRWPTEEKSSAQPFDYLTSGSNSKLALSLSRIKAKPLFDTQALSSKEQNGP